MKRNTPFFSILVPVYNAEKYIEECIDSIICQTFKDWELILVDDGSKDKSTIICDKYAQIYENIVVIHQENGGEFSARKTGLDISQGKYITAVDADDFIKPNHLKKMYDEINKGGYDCVSCTFERFGSINQILAVEEKILKSVESVISETINTLNTSMCNKAIRRECYTNVDYSEAPKVRYSEDEIMLIPALCNVKNMSIYNEATYCYRIHDNAVTRNNSFRYIEFMNDVIEYDLNMVRKKIGDNELLKSEFMFYFWRMIDDRVCDLFVKKQISKRVFNQIKELSLYSSDSIKKTRCRFSYMARLRLYMVDMGMYYSYMIFVTIFQPLCFKM